VWCRVGCGWYMQSVGCVCCCPVGPCWQQLSVLPPRQHVYNWRPTRGLLPSGSWGRGRAIGGMEGWWAAHVATKTVQGFAPALACGARRAAACRGPLPASACIKPSAMQEQEGGWQLGRCVPLARQLRVWQTVGQSTALAGCCGLWAAAGAVVCLPSHHGASSRPVLARCKLPAVGTRFCGDA
jgi:hypothetical protein